MGGAQPWLQTAREILVGQDGVQIHRHLGDAHRLALGRDAGMQIGERLAVIQPFGFRHEALDQRQDPIGAVLEALEHGFPIGVCAGLRPRRASFRRVRRHRPAAATAASGNTGSRNACLLPRTVPCARHRRCGRPDRESRSWDSGWRARAAPR